MHKSFLLPFLLVAAPAVAQGQPRIDPKDLKLPPKLPEMAPPSNIAGLMKQTDPENTLYLDLSTGGRVKIVLRPDVAPAHVERVRTLAKRGFYDGTVFHRVIDGFMAQGGDPTATGTGGSDLPDLKAEFNDLPHVRGAVAMARAQSPDSANSQFYIVLLPVLKLDRQYTVLGRVIEGMQWVDKIEKGEPPANPSKIIKASIATDNVPPPDFSKLVPAATPIPPGALGPQMNFAPAMPAAAPKPAAKPPAKPPAKPVAKTARPA